MRRIHLTHLLNLSKMTAQQKTVKYFVGLYGPVVVTGDELKPAPHLYQAVKCLGDIQKLDLDCDWVVYDDCFLAYLNRANIVLNDNFTEDTLCDYFNAKAVKTERIIE